MYYCIVCIIVDVPIATFVKVRLTLIGGAVKNESIDNVVGVLIAPFEKVRYALTAGAARRGTYNTSLGTEFLF